MTTSNRLFGTISTIYMATAQSSTAVLLQIEQIFHHWKSSKYLITLHWKFLKLYIASLEIFRRYIWLLRKAQFLATAHLSFSCCESPNYLSTANRPTISPLEIVKLFHYSALKNFMTTSHCLFGNISKIYMASAQSQIFRLLRIYDFATAHLPIIYELQIDKLFHDRKSFT